MIFISINYLTFLNRLDWANNSTPLEHDIPVRNSYPLPHSTPVAVPDKPEGRVAMLAVGLALSWVGAPSSIDAAKQAKEETAIPREGAAI